MGNILSDGSVLPHYLGARQIGSLKSQGLYDSIGLLVGEVKGVVYPDDPKSISKKFIEYTVAVQYRRGADAGAAVEFRGCQVMNGIAGVADVMQLTLRPDLNPHQAKRAFGTGSKVLMLCVNGDSSRPIIIGGIRNLEDRGDSRADGHNLYFEFNGLSFAINKDGEATVQFKGPTKWDGTLDTDKGASDDHGPTKVQFLKNGNLVISTKDQSQSITIDHENKKVAFAFDSEWSVNVNGKSSISIGEDLTVTAGTTIALSCKAGVSITSSGLSIGKATDAMLKGTTFRQYQADMHSNLMSQLAQLSANLAAAGTALAGSQFLAAGSQLGQAAAAAAQMAATLGQFEGHADDTLSKVNKAD